MTGTPRSLDQDTFNRLRRLYIIALGAIAISLIASQILIRQYLNDQENDSRLVNVAGRQRMLSQKLNKEVLLLSHAQSAEASTALIDSVQNTLDRWTEAHRVLQLGDESQDFSVDNSPEVTQMFEQIIPDFKQVSEATQNFLFLKSNASADSTAIVGQLNTIERNANSFLIKMDEIVNQYDQEAKDKVASLQHLELLITLFTLLVLVGEFLIIFWPSAKAMKSSIHELIDAKEKAIQMAKNADILSQSKEKSVRELQALSKAMDQILLFARITPEGYITHMGERFSRLYKAQKFNIHAKISDVLSPLENEKLTIDRIITENKKAGWEGELKTTSQTGEDIWLDVSMIPYNSAEDKSELILICLDITKRKEFMHQVEQLTKESFEEKIHQQKIISRQIIENQENEQNRIAKDIHDGIGQMLTGLKYLLESVDTSDPEKAEVKIIKLKELTSNIIMGVRTATFNLTPPELKDYGIVPALTELTQELSKLTGKDIVLFNKSDFNQRLDSLVEINLYRITQEAINNAIKYAESSHIIVTVSHSQNILSIIVDDNGKGFDTSKLKSKPDEEGGMGLTFMKERVKYINGRLFINSSPNEGTKVTLNVPLT
ncbi:type IV pili methyl-accepting chemotaxis transducer N-terminal domain-containing protein [Algoriphagus sp. C2-6-M1]|uniref:sensor histidine kinase n=1 Tax=Algoriphagus persicinus TaxID=3108754 RepID=UPI002B3ABE67|nr:type IV pili methyl-accepting chemotaxis transducer N-terminal domain-containing protein [Algoriphagus sp. C2-6-M1]MEB2779558.1 type IV pili methyl-accepting chemotaxis transducer N-terminal domain-containing protein [Algoriphagus sp. C2-6-M1]